MRDGDAVICFNFRSDRMRQFTRALTEPAFDEFDVSRRPDVQVVTMTQYDQQFTLATRSRRCRWRASSPRC